MQSLSNDEAKRIALAAQGFGQPRPRKPGSKDLKAVFERLKLIQIDSVNVLARAHYMPFFSRLGPYRQALLDELAYRHQHIFEQWAHEACFIPLEHYPLFRYQMERGRRWSARDVGPERMAYFDAVLDELRARGPLVVGQFDGDGRRGSWWGWGDAKVALEYHFAHGKIAVRERRNFTRVYDLAERVFPPEVLARPALTEHEAQRQQLRNSLDALGVATERDLADYYRLKLTAIRPRMNELVDAGEAVPLRVEGWKEPAFLAPGIAQAPASRATAILSPFDNLIWDRARTERIFGFFYRIEIYTRPEKRVHGYYVLPFMHNNQLAARVDLKANRQASVLEVRAAHLEPGANAARTAAALTRELKRIGEWLALDGIEVWVNGSLAPALVRALGPDAVAAESR